MKIEKYLVRVPDWLVERWWRVAYKIPPMLDARLSELIEIRPDAKFDKAVGGFLRGVLEEGKMPPAEIAPAILNMAEDFVNGREMVIKTGDYIAIQGFLRQGK